MGWRSSSCAPWPARPPTRSKRPCAPSPPAPRASAARISAWCRNGPHIWPGCNQTRAGECIDGAFGIVRRTPLDILQVPHPITMEHERMAVRSSVKRLVNRTLAQYGQVIADHRIVPSFDRLRDRLAAADLVPRTVFDIGVA